MPLPWFRVYSDLLNSRKFHQLSDTLKARLLLLWCLSAKHDGILPAVDDIAFSLRLAAEETQQTVDQLKAAGFLEDSSRGLVPHDWNEHQHISDISTGRVKRFRAKPETLREMSTMQERNGGETATETEVRQARNGSEAGCGRLRAEQKRADTEQSRTEDTLSAAEIAAACDLASETFTLTDEQRQEAWDGNSNGNSKPDKALLNGETETVLDKVAVRIHGRHPAIRRCGIAEVKKQLRAIARRAPAATRLDVLRQVDQNHAAWCAWRDWQKDEGQYAKGLANWLAPTLERWNEAPPNDADNPQPPRIMM